MEREDSIDGLRLIRLYRKVNNVCPRKLRTGLQFDEVSGGVSIQDTRIYVMCVVCSVIDCFRAAGLLSS